MPWPSVLCYCWICVSATKPAIVQWLPTSHLPNENWPQLPQRRTRTSVLTNCFFSSINSSYHDKYIFERWERNTENYSHREPKSSLLKNVSLFSGVAFLLVLWEHGFKPNKYSIRKSFSPRYFHDRIPLLVLSQTWALLLLLQLSSTLSQQSYLLMPLGGSVHHVTTYQQAWGLSYIRSEKGFGCLKTKQELQSPLLIAVSCDPKKSLEQVLFLMVSGGQFITWLLWYLEEECVQKAKRTFLFNARNLFQSSLYLFFKIQ